MLKEGDLKIGSYIYYELSSNQSNSRYKDVMPRYSSLYDTGSSGKWAKGMIVDFFLGSRGSPMRILVELPNHGTQWYFMENDFEHLYKEDPTMSGKGKDTVEELICTCTGIELLGIGNPNCPYHNRK